MRTVMSVALSSREKSELIVLGSIHAAREVLNGKRVLLIEDTIVRSTTMKSLLSDIRERGGAKEIHVRVACPQLFAPCFYGIDMSTIGELFAPRSSPAKSQLCEQESMAKELGADSLFTCRSKQSPGDRHAFRAPLPACLTANTRRKP